MRGAIHQMWILPVSRHPACQSVFRQRRKLHAALHHHHGFGARGGYREILSALAAAPARDGTGRSNLTAPILQNWLHFMPACMTMIMVCPKPSPGGGSPATEPTEPPTWPTTRPHTSLSSHSAARDSPRLAIAWISRLCPTSAKLNSPVPRGQSRFRATELPSQRHECEWSSSAWLTGCREYRKPEAPWQRRSAADQPRRSRRVERSAPDFWRVGHRAKLVVFEPTNPLAPSHWRDIKWPPARGARLLRGGRAYCRMRLPRRR